MGKSIPAGLADCADTGGTDGCLGVTGGIGVGGEIFTIGGSLGPGGRWRGVKVMSLKLLVRGRLSGGSEPADIAPDSKIPGTGAFKSSDADGVTVETGGLSTGCSGSGTPRTITSSEAAASGAICVPFGKPFEECWRSLIFAGPNGFSVPSDVGIDAVLTGRGRLGPLGVTKWWLVSADVKEGVTSHGAAVDSRLEVG